MKTLLDGQQLSPTSPQLRSQTTKEEGIEKVLWMMWMINCISWSCKDTTRFDFSLFFYEYIWK